MEMFVLDDDVARLEAVLEQLTGAARLDVLVSLAWHIRQRNSPRSLAIADEATILLSRFMFSNHKQERILARLQLVRGEARYQCADWPMATTLAHAALVIFTKQGDSQGCADAHWLLGAIAGDRGEPPLRDAAFGAMAAVADHRTDALRVGMANIALVRFSITRDFPAAMQRWQNYDEPFDDNDHVAIRAWTLDCKATVAFLDADYGSAIVNWMRAYEAAMSTGQLRQAIYFTAHIGTAFSKLQDHQAALEWRQTGLTLARPSDWSVSIGLCLAQIAQTLQVLGQLDAAEQYLAEAMATVNVSRSYTLALECLINVKFERQNYQTVLELAEQLEHSCQTINQEKIPLRIAAKKARALSVLNHSAEAIGVATQALERAGAHRNERILLLHALGDIHSRHAAPTTNAAPDSNLALKYFLEAIHALAGGDDDLIRACLHTAVAGEYAAVGDHAQAYRHALLAMAAHDRTHHQRLTNRTIAIEARNHIERGRIDAAHRQQLAIAETQRATVLQQTSQALERLSAIGREITGHLDVAAVFRALERHVHGLLDVTTLAVYLLEPDDLSLALAFGAEAGKALPFHRLALSSSTDTARCARERRGILLNQSPHRSGPHQSPTTAPISSALFAPLMIGDRVLGVITVQSPLPYVYGEREQLVFKTLCAYGAIALDNSNAYRQLEATLQTLGHTQAELLDKNIELAQANQIQEKHQSELTRFLAVASHDLRQPMHALNLYLGVLLNIELPEPARPVLANIRQCAQIMDGMFLALLDLSRLDAQVVQPNIERFPIDLVLSRIAVEFAPQAMAKGLDLRVVHCSAWVESDRMLVEQILRNLTANAVRYTETGRILIGCRRRGNVLRLVVHDTGIGISPDQQKAVFEEFCQIGNDRRERNKGLGLGLAIVRRLGRLLDTPITLVSALGRGALFAVDLPRAKNQLHIPAPAIAPMAAGEVLARKLVVVIDDDETILDAMRILLEQWHCIVVIAESGADAIDKLSERLQLPDALICDYRLRRQETGLDVIRTLRNEFNHDIPSLLITGDTAPEEIQKTLLDTVPVLHKPIQAATLHAALIKLIQVH